MHVIADLQLHSRFSRAVSPQMTLPNIAVWAAKKGIGLVATGDWTHPMWFREILANLEEMGNGLLKLKGAEVGATFFKPPPESAPSSSLAPSAQEVAHSKNAHLPAPYFLLATEVSCIYSQGGKGRRVHTLIWVPTIASAEKINKEMTKRGCNLLSDGRPIIGLTSIQVAELVLSIEPKALIIPAHAWTPWFSVFGKMGGFDSIEEAFGPYAKHIYAVETGLSSNPSMNWRIKELDNRAILSFSDAHSGPKLGREATVFEIADGKLSYGAIYQAIVGTRAEVANENLDPSSISLVEGSHPIDTHLSHSQSEAGQNFVGSPRVRSSLNLTPHTLSPSIAYTIEFYPEEGKYHYTGHRACHVRLEPGETKMKGTTCSVCGKPLTQGVMQRVEELASRSEASLQISDVRYQMSDKTEIQMKGSKAFPDRPPFVMLVPLQEIIAEAIGSPVGSPKVSIVYERLVTELGGEFPVLLQSSVSSVSHIAGERVAEGIDKVRRGDIVIEPGYDGVFGVVKIWGDGTKKDASKEQLAMF